MSSTQAVSGGPRGGLQAGARVLRAWCWNGRAAPTTRPVRCKREEWYLARARLASGTPVEHARLLVVFLRDGQQLGQRCLRLHASGSELLGWFETPPTATHLQLRMPDASLGGQLGEIVLRNVAERDPKCHPLASVPRWSVYQPPFPIERVVLPADLAGLTPLLDGMTVELLRKPGSRGELRRRARGAACVISPSLVRELDLTLPRLEQLAATAWVIVDLQTLADVLSRGGAAQTRTVTCFARHGIMSARVAYADVPTRGFARQDVVPYATLAPAGGYEARVLKANRSWRQYADQAAFAPLLTAETPWENRHGDVLSAARPVGGGELIATDLPWLVAGCHGPLLAPRIAGHLLRMHLGRPLADHLQYWNRWDDGNVVVRDISDLAQRHPPLRTVRWPASQPGVERLGLTLGPAAGGQVVRHVLVDTGRIDAVGLHDGLPPEPMMIFMKWLAREARERTDWAGRQLAGQSVTWRFETADGLKYAANYDQAPPPTAPPPEVRLRMTGAGCGTSAGVAVDGVGVARLGDEGLYGDGSLDFQEALTAHLRQAIGQSAGSRRLPTTDAEA